MKIFNMYENAKIRTKLTIYKSIVQQSQDIITVFS